MVDALGSAITLCLIGMHGAIAVADVPQFDEEAVQRGLVHHVVDGAFGGAGQYGCGVALCDLDNDGDDDVVAMGAAGDQLRIFENNGSGQFIDRTVGSGLPVTIRASGLVAGDYDGDGDLDLFLTRWLQSAMMLRNEGGLNFVNATAQTLLTGITGPGTGCAFGDYDADGDLDLAVGMRTNTLANQMRNRLYRNNGNATFTDVAATMGVDDAFPTFQVLLHDLDRDGDCDMYVSNDKGLPGLSWNRLFRNDAGVLVEDCASEACLVIDSMGVCVGDLDLNGLPDIYCTNIATGHVLLMSDGPLHFEQRDAEADVQGNATGWGALIFDADNDIDQDLFACSMMGAPDYLWVTENGFPMVDRSKASGLGDAQDSYCLAAGDVDLDGDVDLLMQSRLANLRLYINSAPKNHSSVSIRIVGVGRNTHAVGALADFEVHGSTVVREVIAGSCYKSQSSYVLHCGIGTEPNAERVTIHWPRVGALREERVLTDVPTGFVLPVYPPSRLGDALNDGRVDPADRAACDACASTEFGPACAVFDMDGDCRITELDRAAVLARLLDVARDGPVGARDLAHLLDGWGRPTLDLTGDKTVNAADVAFLLANW